MIGPGKYDDCATLVREQTSANAVLVVVMGGNKGSGFAVQAHQTISPKMLAELLETIAIQLRADVHLD